MQHYSGILCSREDKEIVKKLLKPSRKAPSSAKRKKRRSAQNSSGKGRLVFCCPRCGEVGSVHINLEAGWMRCERGHDVFILRRSMQSPGYESLAKLGRKMR